jgi:uncharacterized protein DUF3108
MRVGTFCAGLLALTVAGIAAAQPPGPGAPSDADIAPFSARYIAEWKGITVGTSDLKLEHGAQPGEYIYNWTISARGIFRLIYSSDLTQKSWFSVIDEHVRPQKYLAQEGSSSVSLDFDWDGGHARGSSENKPVDILLKSGAQDLMSIQIEAMLDLKNGNLPKLFHIVDKDQMKDFIYTQEGTASVRTALGQLDTVIVSSRRTGNDRILRMWFAPSLGYVPVQAERSRGDRLEFAMRIKSLNR